MPFLFLFFWLRHCRICGQVVCLTCSKERLGDARICDICMENCKEKLNNVAHNRQKKLNKKNPNKNTRFGGGNIKFKFDEFFFQ